MKIFPSDVVREIDRYTIENEPIKSIDLMERAASKLVDRYVYFFKNNRKVIILTGPGNNGGDALAMARMLADRQYKVECYLVSASGKYSENCLVNLKRLEKQGIVSIQNISNVGEFPLIDLADVIVDGLFGSGLTRILDGVYKELIKHVNEHQATVVSIDIPSGLFGEDNTVNQMDSIIKAHHTLTFQFPFLSFFFSENENYTGLWQVLDIGLNKEFINKTKASYSITSRGDISEILPQRGKHAHKGTFGHALVIAGSYGMMGAAVLAGEATLRSGAGLVTVHIPEIGYNILQLAVPEAIVSIDDSEHYFTTLPDLRKYSAITAGPGLGLNAASARGVRDLLLTAEVPLVLDADALNLIAADNELLEMIPAGTILTPHPGEFDRLVGESKDAWSRHIKQIDLSISKSLIIVLKGAYTGISFPDGTYIFNSTGNPGMATGGSGDVLSGIIVSLLSQGMSPSEAAVAGVYIHGMAGDIASEKSSQEAMIASDIIESLGETFQQVKAKPFLHEGRKGGVESRKSTLQTL